MHTTFRSGRRALAALVIATAAAVALAGCGGDEADASSDGTSSVTVRLGYFPNLTHATAIVGVEDGHFADALGSNKVKTQTFNAGPEATQALLSGALDATYIGPGPATNAYAKSGGQAVRVISGATSGGAALVVKPEITSVEDLKGKKIATPQLGNTQDIALRSWLKEEGFETTTEGGGDVQILPQENSQTADTFATGQIDGAWVPEPYLSRLVNDDPVHAQEVVGAAIGKLTGKPLDPKLVSQAWESLTFTDDPLPATLITGAEHATAVGLLDKVENLEGIYDLKLLNEVLKAEGQPAVDSP